MSYLDGLGALVFFDLEDFVLECVEVVERLALDRERPDDVDERRSVFFFASLRALRSSERERMLVRVLLKR